MQKTLPAYFTLELDEWVISINFDFKGIRQSTNKTHPIMKPVEQVADLFQLGQISDLPY